MDRPKTQATERAFSFHIMASVPDSVRRLTVRAWNNVLQERLPGIAYFSYFGIKTGDGPTARFTYTMQACDKAWQAYNRRGESFTPYVQARVEGDNVGALVKPQALADRAVGIN